MKNIGTALWLALSSAVLIGALFTFLHFGDPDPSGSAALFLVLFVMFPVAIVATALGIVGLILYFLPSRKANRRIWRLLAILALSSPSFAFFLFIAPDIFHFVKL
jgi:hypothetical protein